MSSVSDIKLIRTDFSVLKILFIKSSALETIYNHRSLSYCKAHSSITYGKSSKIKSMIHLTILLTQGKL